MTTLSEAMQKYMSKALEAREAFYQGQREAAAYGQPSPLAAQQRWEVSPKAKELISSNRWNMSQAVMFGIGAILEQVTTIANASVDIACTLHDIKTMMEAENSGGQGSTPRGASGRWPDNVPFPRRGD